MTETEKYSRRYLKEELRSVNASPIGAVENGLDAYEKSVVYHYTCSGYLTINRAYRKKIKRLPKAGILLRRILKKLPDYHGQVYRAAALTPKQIQYYRKALKNNVPITEAAFVSTSISPLTVRLYRNWNVRFQIISRHGKNIDEMSHLGKYKPPNEQEVLFPPGSSFTVLEVTDSKEFVLIFMEEI